MSIIKEASFTIILADKTGENNNTLTKTILESGACILEVSSITQITSVLSSDTCVAYIIINSQLLVEGTSNDILILKEHVNQQQLPVIILMDNDGKIDELLIQCGFELMDVLKKDEEPVIVANKIKIFNSLFYYKNKLAKSISEKKYECLELPHFVQVIAHDLKSPLATSVFLLSILLKEKDREKDRPGIKDHIRKIYEANVHLSEMITLAADHIQSSLKNQIKESVNTRHLLKQIISSIPHLNYGQFIFEGDFPVLFTNKLKLQRIFELLLLSLAENNNEDEEIIIGVTGKTLFYEFYISYNSRLQVPDFKKIFIFPKDSVPTKKQPSKIGLNVIKMLVEEQCGKLELVKKTGEKNTVSFEWMK